MKLSNMLNKSYKKVEITNDDLGNDRFKMIDIGFMKIIKYP